MSQNITETAETYDEARTLLKNEWETPMGSISCPQCGCLAQDWRTFANVLVMTCEDCRYEEDIEFQDGGPLHAV